MLTATDGQRIKRNKEYHPQMHAQTKGNQQSDNQSMAGLEHDQDPSSSIQPATWLKITFLSNDGGVL